MSDEIPFSVKFWAYATIYGLKLLSVLILLCIVMLMLLSWGWVFDVDVVGSLRRVDGTIIPYWGVLGTVIWIFHGPLHQRLLLWWSGYKDGEDEEAEDVDFSE